MWEELYFYIPSVPVWHVIGQPLPSFTLFCRNNFLHFFVNRNTIGRNWYLHRSLQIVERYFICRIQHVILQGRHIILISHWRYFLRVVTLRQKKVKFVYTLQIPWLISLSKKKKRKKKLLPVFLLFCVFFTSLCHDIYLLNICSCKSKALV
jgi:hypothetical protein